MRKLEINNHYSINTLNRHRNEDYNKYKFSFWYEMSWKKSDMSEEDAKIIDECCNSHNRNDVNKFLGLINKYYFNDTFKAIKLLDTRDGRVIEVYAQNVISLTLNKYLTECKEFFKDKMTNDDEVLLDYIEF